MTSPRTVGRETAPEGEEGAALIMAVIIMTVLTSLSLAVLGRTLSVLQFMRHGQDYDGALAEADAGLADALFKIDQAAPATWETEALQTTGERRFKYWAQKNSDTEYVVSSVGYAGASTHGLQARVTRTAKFPYALFSQGPLHLDGAATAGNVKIAFGVFEGSGQVRVGSNATVVCNGVVPPGVVVDWYQSQSECPVTQVNKLDIPRDLSIDYPPQPAGPPDPNWENCPVDGIFTGVVSGNLGPYVCRRNVTLVGTVAPDPNEKPVEIYIAPRTNADGSLTHYALDMSTAIVNPLQPASRFQIYKAGAGPVVHNAVTDLTFRGVLFAPDTPMRIDGGHLHWAGSINVGQLKVNGTPNLKILYDLDLETYLGPDWRVSRYREITASEALPIWGTP